MALSLKPGAEPIPGYRLVRQLGQGGFGQVWEAEPPGGFPIAIKFVPLTQNVGLERRSLEVMRRIGRHSNLLDLFFAFELKGYLAIGMVLCEQSLLDRLHECQAAGQSAISRDELLVYMRDAARALDFLNLEKQVQHRDVKPHNLFLVGGSVKLADFGLVKPLAGFDGNHTGPMTPQYAPPEMLFGKGIARTSDQYSLAVTYCHLLTGRAPAVCFPDLAMLPPHDRRVLTRALAETPIERYPSCMEMVQRLEGGAAWRNLWGWIGRRADGTGGVSLPAPVEPNLVPTPRKISRPVPTEQSRAETPQSPAEMLLELQAAERALRAEEAKAQAAQAARVKALDNSDPLLARPPSQRLGDVRPASPTYRAGDAQPTPPVMHPTWNPDLTADGAERQQIAETQRLLVALQILNAADWTRAVQWAGRPEITAILRRLTETPRPPTSDDWGWQPVMTTYQAQRVSEGYAELLRLGDYLLLQPFNDGSAFHARFVPNQRNVLVKILRQQPDDDPRITQPWRFALDGKILQRLHHPCIPKMLDAGTQSYAGGKYIVHYNVMELIRGQTLEQVANEARARGELVPVWWAVRRIWQAAQVLQYAHQRQLIHRCIHPRHLLVTAQCQTAIVDWAMAKQINTQKELGMITENGKPLGIADTMPPEQWHTPADVSPASDCYSLGVVLFFLLTGQYPFSGKPADMMKAHFQARRPAVSDFRREVTGALNKIVARMMHSNPRSRYGDMASLQRALDAYRQPSTHQRQSEDRKHWRG